MFNLVLSLFLFILTPLFSQDAYINKMKGQLEIFDSQGKDIKPAIHSPLYEGYTIRTAKNGKCEIIFKDKSVIFISENSEIKIDKTLIQDENRDFSLNFLSGKILFFVQRILNSNYKIKTPTAVCAVRGTDFSIIVSSSSSLVGLFDGKMDIEKDNQIKELNPGSEAEISNEIFINNRLSSIMEKEKKRADKLKKYVEKLRRKMEIREKKIKEKQEKSREKIENFKNRK